jgi:hypothetical protein
LAHGFDHATHWIFVLPKNIRKVYFKAVFTGDYRPHSEPVSWHGFKKVIPVSLLHYDSSFDNPEVLLPSVPQSLRALQQVYQHAQTQEKTLAVICHTGGTEQLVALWCREQRKTWFVQSSCKHEQETYLGLLELAGAYEAVEESKAHVVCVGDKFKRDTPGYTLVKPSVLWFLCHAEELLERKTPLSEAVRDSQGTWRLFYSPHSSYEENRTLIRQLKATKTQACVKEIIPQNCERGGGVTPG